MQNGRVVNIDEKADAPILFGLPPRIGVLAVSAGPPEVSLEGFSMFSESVDPNSISVGDLTESLGPLGVELLGYGLERYVPRAAWRGSQEQACVQEGSNRRMHAHPYCCGPVWSPTNEKAPPFRFLTAKDGGDAETLRVRIRRGDWSFPGTVFPFLRSK